MKSVQKGFTLIELMIVVAIVGILAAVAIPAYQDYTIRAQVTEAMSLVGNMKAAIVESYANTGSWPADNAAVGMGTVAGKYVSGMVVDAGIVTATFGTGANSALNSKKLSFTPGLNANNDVVWQCGNKGAPSGVTLAGTGTTDIDNKYLPTECRGTAPTP